MTADPAEQTAWQRRATAVLAGLLEQAARDALPVLWWTRGQHGLRPGRPLAGQSFRSPTRRPEAWGRALGIPLREHKWRSGGSNVTGSAQHGSCTVTLTADVYADDDGGGEGSGS